MVEGTGFENQRRGNPIESSNLSVSAGANKHYVYLRDLNWERGRENGSFPVVEAVTEGSVGTARFPKHSGASSEILSVSALARKDIYQL